MSRIANKRRTGFTIIELLVAISLMILVMAVLAEAFTVGLKSFSDLKAVGDMSDKLRAAANMIRKDLQADHFEASVRLSDPNLGTQPPREGFFCIQQFTRSYPEGIADNIKSFRNPLAAGGSHVLHFSVKLRGNRRDNFFGATCPAGSPLLAAPDKTTFFNQLADARYQDPTGTLYTSQWAEVAYFLQQYPTNPQPNANGTAMFCLHRVVKVVVANSTAINGSGNANDYGGFSLQTPANTNFNTPQDLTVPSNRAMKPFIIDQAPDGVFPPAAGVSTLLLNDVVSFDVQMLAAPLIPAPAQGQALNFGFPVGSTNPTGNVIDFTDAPLSPVGTFMYESSNTQSGILAVKISIRVWDQRTQQTRQITIIQDM